MKKTFLYAIVLVATLNLGCENKLFQYSVTIEQSGDYNIVEPTGTFTKSAFISRTSVAKSFRLPEGAKVKELNIESLSMKVIVANTNQAIDVTVLGRISKGLNNFENLFDNKTITLGGAGGGLAGESEIAINLLLIGGVAQLKSTLQDFVKGLGTTSLIEIILSGFSTPSRSRIDFTVVLEIKATVTYERCERILTGMSDGPGCAEGETVH